MTFASPSLPENTLDYSQAAGDSKVLVIKNALLLRGKHFIREDLWVAAGKIVHPQSRADHSIDGAGLFISPGLIDLQINGAFGTDFTKSPHELSAVANLLPQFGVTAFLPTIISSPAEIYPKLLSNYQTALSHTFQGANALGLHLEGPFFNPEKTGAHCRDYLQAKCTPASLMECYTHLEGVRLITLAPELPGALDTIAFLKQKGISVGAGHSLASLEQMDKAIEMGLSLVTHLFNAMASLTAREPSIAAAALVKDGMFYTLIADGIHVHPTIVKLAWKANPAGLILISDGISAMGTGHLSSSLAGLDVEINQGGAYLKGEKVLAGSILSLNKAVQLFQKMSGCTLAEALLAASSKPAAFLGLQKSKGTLEVGADADFILIDEQVNVHATFIAGRRVF